MIDPFRPGVAERLNIGPDECLKLNPRLIYCRMTGWGQDGPLAKAAGHDINYIALTGLLSAIGRKGDKPALPLNLVGDYGGGGMLLAFGMVCGLLEAQRSGKGQVVDVAMTDGAALLFGSIAGLHASGYWTDERGTNLLDSGAHFYDVYETADGKYVSIGSIEPQFYAILLDKLGLAGADLPAQMDRSAWPGLKERFTALFKTKTRERVVSDHGGDGHLLRAGSRHRRGVAASAQPGATGARERGGRMAAGARAALQPHRAGGAGRGAGARVADGRGARPRRVQRARDRGAPAVRSRPVVKGSS